MRSAYTRCLMWAMCLLGTGILQAQYCFIPNVINADRTEEVALEYKVSDFTTVARYEVNGVFYEMYDNGQNGDRIAGDRIFTIRLDPQVIVSAMREEDAFRAPAGSVHPCIGEDTYKCTDVFLPVRTDDMPDVPVAAYGHVMQVSPHVINIRSSKMLTYDQVFQRLQVYNVSRDVDFLIMVEIPSRNAVHKYTSLRNDVSGIGLPVFDDVTNGSVPPRFKGVLTLPMVDKFDGVSRMIVRSLARQWAPQLGPPFSACGHWAVSDLARSIVGYDENGVPLCYSENFQYRISPVQGSNDYQLIYAPQDVKHFNNMELYLMGLKRAAEVESFRVFKEQPAVLNALKMHPLAYHGPVDTYSITDVIERVGPRTPGFYDAPKEFSVYTVVVTPELLTREEIAYFDYMAARGESSQVLHTRNGQLKELGVSFNTATRGTGTLSWNIKNMTFPHRNIIQEVCFGEVYAFNGVEYTEPGIYPGIIENDNGVDTLIDLHLTWLPKSESAVAGEVCMGDSYDFNGRLLDAPGVYRDTIANAFGCDSFITLDLAVLPSELDERFEVICSDEKYIFAGDTLNEPGVYFDIHTNRYGCDSSTMLTLEVEPAVEAGAISATGNQQYYTVCIEDGLQDLIWFSSTNDAAPHVYILTDPYNQVIDIVFEPVYDFEPTGPEPELIWGASYTGNLLLDLGDDLFNTEISDQCYDISTNYIEVRKQADGAICDFIHQEEHNRDDDLTIAPNPAKDILNVALNRHGDDLPAWDARLEVIGVRGEVFESMEVRVDRGAYTWSIDVSGLAPGLYMVRITGMNRALRFVKA